jgi:hypothetical protein
MEDKNMENGNLRDAIEYLVGLGEEGAKPEVIAIGGKTYCTKNLVRYDKEEMAEPLKAASLTALVDYVKNSQHELREKMLIQIVGPEKVKLISSLTKERNRECLFESNVNSNGFIFNQYYDQEDFIINMQAAFQETEDLKILLQVAGNVENNATANYGDDGVSQKTTIKKGIASKVDVVVPNPVKLAPFRTFLEVQQPESEFIFRIGEGRNGEPNFKLVSADGGLWKYDAVESIKDYLYKQLSDFENITIIG